MEFVTLVLSRNFRGGTCRRNRRRNLGGNCCRLLLGPWRGMCTTGSSLDPVVVNHFSCLLVVTSAVGHCTYYNNSHTPLRGPSFFFFVRKNHASRAQGKLSMWCCCFHSSVEHTCAVSTLYVLYLPQSGRCWWINQPRSPCGNASNH